MDQSRSTTSERGRSLYPSHLAKGDGNRVPLHRRGKSKTYERLEDLLREAGYKETRIFSADTEQFEVLPDGRRKAAREHNVGESRATPLRSQRVSTMVRLLTNFIPWHGEQPTAEPQSRSDSSAGGRKLSGTHGIIDPWQRLESLTPNRELPLSKPAKLSSDHSSYSSISSTPSNSPPLFPHAQLPSRNDARSTLRHMISAPSLPARPTSSMTRRPTTPYCMRGQRGCHSPVPPIPQIPEKWRSYVTPVSVTDKEISSDVSPGLTNGIRRGRPLARSVIRADLQLGSSNNATRRSFTPHTARAPTSPGVVVAASVVCRSAPGSRSTSLVRGHGSNGNAKKRQCRDHISARVPSLGVTSVNQENIEWPLSELLNEQASIRLDSESDEDTDSGELDFAQLIMPARRQHSIQSLRRNLHNHNAAAMAAVDSLKRPRSRRERQSTASSRANSIRYVHRSAYASYASDEDDAFIDPLEDDTRRHGSIDDAEEGLADWAAHGLPGLENADQKRRGSLPWTWAHGG